MTDADKLIEAVARAICRQNLLSTNQPADDVTMDYYWRSFEREAIAALSAIDGSGTHAVVPVIPTGEMMLSGGEAAGAYTKRTMDASIDAYDAMISARPRITGETE